MAHSLRLFARAVLVLVLAGVLPALAAEDVEGSKDHPLFNRMPRFVIASYAEKEFDAFSFPTGTRLDDDATKETVEGRSFEIAYSQEEGATSTALQVFRNFENALRKANAVFVAKPPFDRGSSYNFMTARLTRSGGEVWVLLTGTDGNYQLTIVEKQAMAQVIRADDMYAALGRDGFIALDVHFDTAKATIRPESQPIIDEIAKLLKAHPALKVGVEGHTDATGTPTGNRKLSQERARSVVAAVAQLGVAAERMRPAGWGQDRPVADDRTEEGRARNRRVEIVRR
jgi:outer membrane protein OmpA-like peptidoglycan-associated protein